MIAIIDYDAGNIKSVEKALISLGEKALITRDKETILNADKVILPGVGAIGDAMGKLRAYGLEEVINQVVAKNTPFLGICLGLQLIFDSSEEGVGVKGLSLLPGKIKKFHEGMGLKIPQIGWNSLHFTNDCPLFKGIDEGEYVYFVHSYYLMADEERDVAATANYGIDFHAAVWRDNVYACQFHPEKSSEVGLKILKNFIGL